MPDENENRAYGVNVDPVWLAEQLSNHADDLRTEAALMDHLAGTLTKRTWVLDAEEQEEGDNG
jgi:hypothetical protein